MTMNEGRFDKEANAAAMGAARPGKQLWYNFRPDLLSYPRESSKGAAVVDAIVESFCRRNLTFTVSDIHACRRGVPQEFVRGAVESQFSDLVRDEYIRRCAAGYERVPVEILDEFSGRGNGGASERARASALSKRSTSLTPVADAGKGSSQIVPSSDINLQDVDATKRMLSTIEKQIADKSGFDPTSIKDARTRTLAAIVRRRGQPAFRKALLSAYNYACAISRCRVEEVLEAAHIIPYQGDETDVPENGLLLRADLHTLFDVKLISVDDAKMRVLVSPQLDGTDYERLRGQPIALPDNPEARPNQTALRHHRAECGL